VIFVNLPNFTPVQRVVSVNKGRIRAISIALSPIQSVTQAGKIAVTTTPPGAMITVAEPTATAMGTSPIVLSLSAGRHILFVSLPGYQQTQQIALVQAAKTTPLHVILAPLSQDTLVLPPTAMIGAMVTFVNTKPTSRLRTSSYALFGVAGLVGSVAMGTGIKASGVHDKWKKDHDPASARELHRYTVTTDVLLGIGISSALAATVLLIVDSKKKKKDRAKAILSPACGPGGCGVLVRGTF